MMKPDLCDEENFEIKHLLCKSLLHAFSKVDFISISTFLAIPPDFYHIKFSTIPPKTTHSIDLF